MIYGNSKWNKYLENYLYGFLQTRMSPMWIALSANDSNFSDNFPKEEYEVNHTKDGKYFMIEVPGFNKNNLKLEMEGTKLLITGKRTYKVNGENTERTFFKSCDLGGVYDESLIEATVEDGILTVFVPDMKKREKKKISIS